MIDPGLEPGLCEPRAGVLNFPSAQLYTERVGLHSGAVCLSLLGSCWC